MMAPNDFDWTYTPLIYQDWQPGDAWSALVDDEHYLLPLAREAFWNHHRERILSALQTWTASGWEPVDEVGPASIQVCKSQELGARITLIDVFFWVLTLGIGLVIHLFLGNSRSYVVYRPVAFRVRMRLLKAKTNPTVSVPTVTEGRLSAIEHTLEHSVEDALA
jgi:hypothetical protein